MPPGARLCLTTPTYVSDCVSDGRRPENIRTSSTQLLVCAIVASARHSPLAVASVLAHLSSTIKQLPARSGAGYGSHQRGPSRFSNPLTVPAPAAPNPPKGPAASYSSQPAAEFAAMELTRDVAVSGAACGARLRASAGGGCGPHGSKEPHDTTAIVARTFVPHSPRHPFQRLFLASCCGLPQRVGRLEERRHERLRPLLVALRSRRFACPPRRFSVLQLGQREPDLPRLPVRGLPRALRPSICPEAVFTIFSLSLACAEDTSASGMLK